MRLRRSGPETPAVFDAAALAGASMALLLGIVGAGLRAVGDAPFARPVELESRTRVLAPPVIVTRPSKSVPARAALAEGSVVLGRRVESASSPTAGVNVPRAPSSPQGPQWQPQPRPDIRPVENPPQNGGTQPGPVPAPPGTTTPSPTPVPSETPTVEPSPTPPPDTPAPGLPGDGEQPSGGGPPDHSKKDKEKAAKSKGGKDDNAGSDLPLDDEEKSKRD